VEAIGRRVPLLACLLFWLLFGPAACAAPAPGPASSLPLTLIRDVELPGGATRLDYQAVDPSGRRLYIAHMGDATVHAVDLDNSTVAGTVTGMESVRGVAAAPDRHLLLAAASGSNEAFLIDTRTLAVTGRVRTGDGPDGIAYDPARGKAYVSNQDGDAETVIDVGAGRAVGSIDIGGEAGNTVFDPASGNILVNAQARNELFTINPATDAVTGRIRLDGCRGNHGLAVDGPARLAFIACEDNATLLVADLRTGRTAGRFATGDGPDVLAFDQGLHRLYVASESGVVSIFNEHDRSLRPVATGKLADHAHTVAVDQATHRVYFPLQEVNGHPVLRIMAPAP
jgi:YVTN family beta-propeller protein